MTTAPELRRDWFFTPGAEWILWDDPRSGKLKAFRVILTERRVFLEWTEENGYAAGTSDDGDRPGRSKMSPVLEAKPGMERAVAPLVLELVRTVRATPPVLHGTPIALPKGALQSIAELLEHLTAPPAS